MINCPKCGNKLSPVDVLCPRCGSLVEVIQASDFSLPDSKMEKSRSGSSVPADTFEAATTRQGRKSMLSGRPLSVDASAPEPESKTWLEIEEYDPSVADKDAKPDFHNDINPTFTDTPAPSADIQQSPDTQSPDMQSPDMQSPDTQSPDTQSPDMQSPDMQSPDMQSPDMQSPDMQSPDAVSPDAVSPDAVIEDDPSEEATPRRYRSREKVISDDFYTEPSVRPKRLSAVFVWLIWLLAAAAVFAGFYFAETFVVKTYGGWEQFVRQLTDGKVELDINASNLNSIDVSISEAQTQDGAPAHRFDISMADGKTIRVLPVGDSYQMDGGSVSFTLSDETIAKALGAVTSDATVETGGVSLDVETSSQSFTYPITSLTLRLTDSLYTREEPASDAPSTADDTLDIALTVSPDAMVFINNANKSAGIGEDGRLSLSMPLEFGENLFYIETIQPGHRSVKESLTVTRELPKISLNLQDEYMRVFKSSFECSGTTVAGATVAASLNGKEFSASVSQDGSFFISCSLENTGVYQMDITASKEGLSDTLIPVLVEYLPEQTVFMENAKDLTVAKIVKDMDSLKNSGIMTDGTISGSVTSQAHKQSFVIKSDEAQLNCYYYGAENLSTELFYIFYGMIDPEQNSFYVMFVK